MSRLPFDPSKMAAAKAATSATSATPQPLTVSQLGALIDSALKRATPLAIEVIGEVSGFTDRTHWYFDLKDASSVVNCVMFQFAAKRVPFRVSSGMSIKAKGKLEYYAKGGRVSFLVERIEAVGAGALDQQLKALVEEIRSLGWLDPARKRPLPRFPRRIAVITSKTGAALQDVLVTMKRRAPFVSVLLADVRVQGDAAASEVTQAIHTLNARKSELQLDAILITRGGGSMEDLWPFNNRELAHAIVSSSLPVVAAIGHETDTTIAELVADERCATPTQAAMRLTPDREAILEQLDSTSRRLGSVLVRAIATAQQRVQSLSRRPALDPVTILRHRSRQFQLTQTRLYPAARSRLANSREAITSLTHRLERSRPDVVFARLISRLSLAEGQLHAALRNRLVTHRVIELQRRLAASLLTRLKQSRETIEAKRRHLDAVSPTNTLSRGYSITLDDKGQLIRQVADAPPGTRLITRLQSGELVSRVEGTPRPRPTSTTPPHPPPHKAKTSDDPESTLFS